MITADRERIEIDLPTDVIFAMRGMGKPEMVRKKLKVALAVFLFQEETISLGKAAELAEMSRVQFTELLQSYGIAAYEYSERDFGQDMELILRSHEYTDTLPDPVFDREYDDWLEKLIGLYPVETPDEILIRRIETERDGWE